MSADAPPTLVVNRPRCVIALPHVPTAWAVTEGNVEALADDIPPMLHGRSIIVWVHGFRQRYFRVIGLASHLAHRLAATPADAGQAPTVLAFLWPCHKKRAAYARARA
eukprot:CAMPEP_0206175742 /NCGR_PEP_ID=MMETSP1474-20131121/55918_1 /ASSEMBLY_ACC=CAM_ASM_001110 /TAXON_ID=97495 /ORGANISM="Imantonia sp., Strain RCC918" /LENGTH=107 /DNA_ID=CAMNT_0053586219 /DNA_START=20 /DNA_END=339 /DNA_ORIENTATION=-